MAQTTGPTIARPATIAEPATPKLRIFENGEYDLKQGESQSFRIQLIAGQFLHAVIEQREIDVALVSYDPNGKQVGECDSPNDRWDSETILIVANVSGEYRIDVSSTNSKASAGSYQIKIMALRETTGGRSGSRGRPANFL